MKTSTSEEEQKILISDFQYRKGLKEQSDFPDDSHSTMSTRSSSRGGSSQTHAILGGASLQTSGAGTMILQGDAGAAGLHRTGVRTGASEASSSSASGSSRDKYSSKVSNFAIQYNLGCATLAIAIMQTRGDVIVDPAVTAPDFPVLTKTEKTLALAMIFLGNIVGMLVMGYLGDLLGVARALCVTTAVSIAGQVGVAFLTHGAWIYEIFIFFRFVLGIGVGGLYPLSAKQAAQQPMKHDSGYDKTAAVGWNFFWQQPGNCAPYVIGLLLLSISTNTAFQFRALVSVGIIPLAMVLHWNLEKVREEEQDLATAARGNTYNASTSRKSSSSATTAAATTFGSTSLNADAENPLDTTTASSDVGSPSSGTSLEEAGTTTGEQVFPPRRIGADEDRPHDDARYLTPYNLATLVGTGGTWFLFDVAYYGTQIFAPFILQQIFTDRNLTTNCAQSLVSACFQIPGTVCGIWYLRKVSVKTLNSHGFIAMGLVFAWLAYGKAAGYPAYVLYALFCLLQFTLGFGCILATYILPTIVFEERVRGTMHGVSAGLGKLGAAAGAFLFPVISNNLAPEVSNQTLMGIQALVCAAGLVVNIAYVPRVMSEVRQLLTVPAARRSEPAAGRAEPAAGRAEPATCRGIGTGTLEQLRSGCAVWWNEGRAGANEVARGGEIRGEKSGGHLRGGGEGFGSFRMELTDAAPL
eukprot:g395.t1